MKRATKKECIESKSGRVEIIHYLCNVKQKQLIKCK